MAVKHYVDEIPPSDGRRYVLQTTDTGSKITDVTKYEQAGSGFGAGDVNSACVLECNYAKNGNIHALTTPNVNSENIKFFATAAFSKGDTFTFNGVAVTAQTTDGQGLSPNFFKANTIVECNKRGNVLYFGSSNRAIADDTNGKTYRVGVEDGRMYIEEE